MKKWIPLVLCLMLVLPLSVRAEEAVPQTTAHTHTFTTQTVQATCTQAGSTTNTCSGCGESTTQEIPATGHSWGGWTNAGDGSHSHACTVCGVSESASHSWGEGQVTAAASCTATGTKVYTCSCGASKSETIPVTAHSYGTWTTTDTAHSRTCVCGKTDSGSHSWVVSVNLPATCLKEGAITYVCSVCNAVSSVVQPKLNLHIYENVCDADCDICGATREASHKPTSQWSKNASGHWHACSACGAQVDFGKHFAGPAATEEKAQLCLTCGYTLTAKLGHTHKYETQWTGDETGHWYACSGCDERKDFEEHSFDNICDPDCNKCGYQSFLSHSYSGTWLSNDEGHWDVCTICQEQSAVEPHIPGPGAAGTQICIACNFELAPAEETVPQTEPEPTEHVHEGEEAWKTDADSHWKLCACGEEMDRQPHTWGDGQEQEDATILYTCKDCGQTRTEDASKGGISPLVWIGALLVTLLAAAAATAVVLFRRLRMGKKKNS